MHSELRVTLTEHEFEKKPSQEEQFLSSGSATVVTDAQTVKRKAEETVETDGRSKERQTAVTPVPQVHVGGSSSSGEHGHSVSPIQTEQRVVVPPEVPQDERSSIEDVEISQLRVKREVREVQGVSLDADKRELQRLAREY